LGDSQDNEKKLKLPSYFLNTPMNILIKGSKGKNVQMLQNISKNGPPISLQGYEVIGFRWYA
jgi:hypothetical protein